MLRCSLRLALYTLVGIAFGAVLTGCGVVGGAGPTKTPTQTSTPTRTSTFTPSPTPTHTSTPTPTATPTPAPLAMSLSSDILEQGGTALVSVSPIGNLGSATLTFRGISRQMFADDDDEFWLPIGAGAGSQTGVFDVVVTTYTADGAVADTLASSITIVATAWPVEYLEVPVGGPNGLRPPEDVAYEENIRASTYAVVTPAKYWIGPFMIPVVGGTTTSFGTARSINGAPPSLNHSGEDYGAETGTTVWAAAPGVVAFAGELTVRGTSIMIDHGAGVFTAYHHLSRIDVAQGQFVNQGDNIGAVGMTGLATGPHLHWELIVYGVNVNPVSWTIPGVAP